jgi:hypothetical protein
LKGWRQSDRYSFYETMEIEVSKLPKELRPAVTLITDAQLRKIRTKEAKDELARREKLREEHVKAGRVRYVFLTKGYQDRSIWWVHRLPTRTASKDQGYPEGQSSQSRSQGISLAQMMLVHQDEGGVIYAEPGGFKNEEPTVIDVRPSTCEHLLLHGKHDWFYVPTGDDVCRSCGLVT